MKHTEDKSEIRSTKSETNISNFEFRYSKLLRVWWRAVTIRFAVVSASRIDFFSFLAGKLARMGFFLVFVLAIFGYAPEIAGYNRGQVLLFFAVMNLMDVIVQLVWFRGLSDLSRLVRTGEFDLVLTKPFSPLFWSAFREFDFFDLTTVPAAGAFLWYAFHELAAAGVIPTLPQMMLGILLMATGLVIAFALNLALAAMNFWTVMSENAWWIYRDTMYVARFPPEVFPQAIRIFFTFAVPILVIVAFPAKAFLGLLSPAGAAWAFVAAAIFLWIALRIWNAGLKHYSSASA